MIITLSEKKKQIQKGTYCVIPLLWNLRVGRTNSQQQNPKQQFPMGMGIDWEGA